MTITVEIDDAALPAFDAYIAQQVRASIDPVTKLGVVTPIYSGVEDLVRKQVAAMVTSVTENFSQ